MKKITLKTRKNLSLIAMLLASVITKAQTQTCTVETFTTQTTDWTYSNGTNERNYNRPNNCQQDRGIVTPGVGGNNPSTIKTREFQSLGFNNVGVDFNLYVFNANLNCNTFKDFDCQTSIDVYYWVGNTKYIGISDHLLPPNGPGGTTNISVNFNVGSNLPIGTNYRIQIDFKPKSGLGNCVQGNTKYVLDDFRKCEFQVLSISGVTLNSYKKDKVANLVWTSESEETISNYQVEKSLDCRKFDVIGTVLNSNSNKYKFTDTSTYERVYYRIKVVYKDGSYKYSNVSTVFSNSRVNVSIFPSVASNHINVYFYSNKKERVYITIVDNFGRMVRQQSNDVYVGTNNIVVQDILNLSEGTYFLNIRLSDKTLTSKFIKW